MGEVVENRNDQLVFKASSNTTSSFARERDLVCMLHVVERINVGEAYVYDPVFSVLILINY